MHSITCRLRSIPRWPTPSNVMVSTWACDGTERSPGTMMSSAAVTDSHRTSSGNGVEATRRNNGEPGRSARTISGNGNTPAQGDPPNGDPRVMTCVNPPVQTTVGDGLRDDNTAQTVSDQMHLVCTGSHTGSFPPRRPVAQPAAPPTFRAADSSSLRRSGLGLSGCARPTTSLPWCPRSRGRAARDVWRDAAGASTGGEVLLGSSKPPLTRRRGVIAAADISIAASLACTLAARPAVRTAARAPPSTRRGVVRPLCLRGSQTRCLRCRLVGCSCTMSCPLSYLFENDGRRIGCRQCQPQSRVRGCRSRSLLATGKPRRSPMAPPVKARLLLQLAGRRHWR